MANAKFKIKGRKNIPNYDDPDLEIEVDDKYEAYSKPIPDPTPYQSGFITWFNNFGVKEKATGQNKDVTYTVTLQALPAGKTLFVLYGGEPHEMPHQDAGNGKIKFSLDVSDPPAGSYP